MVFGYYTVSIRKIGPHELPPVLLPEQGGYYEKVSKLAHLMFIPFFPLETFWVLNQQGVRYKLTPQAVQMLDTVFGPIKAPWYAYSGLILILVSSIAYSINGEIQGKKIAKERKAYDQQLLDGRLASIRQATENDYYTIGYNPVKQTVIKVSSVMRDSIEFLAPADLETAPNLYGAPQIVGYFLSPDVVLEKKKIAKADLEKIAQETNSINFSAPSPVPYFLSGKNFYISEITQIDPKTVAYEYADSKNAEEVRTAMQAFVASFKDIKASMSKIDSASTAYFKDMLSAAQTKDVEQMKAFVEASSYSLITYKYMLYTQYTYLKADGKSTGAIHSEKLKDYAFFLKLLEQGLWNAGFDDFDQSVAISDVLFFSPDRAKININAGSNMLSRKETISFVVLANRENGAWKINVPSTFDFTQKQINIGVQGTQRSVKYRQMVREEVAELDEGKNKVTIAQAWEY